MNVSNITRLPVPRFSDIDLLRPRFDSGVCGCEGESAAVAHLRSLLLNVPQEGLTRYQLDRTESARAFLREFDDANHMESR